MAYTKQTWNDGQAGGTPVSSARLAVIETGVDEAHDLYELGVAAAAETLVNVQESTTSTSFTDLATAGPAVTLAVPPSGKVLIILSGILYAAASGSRQFMSFALSGANTLAASDPNALRVGNLTAVDFHMSRVTSLSGLTPGSTTFTAKYRTTAGTGNFTNRSLVVVPL